MNDTNSRPTFGAIKGNNTPFTANNNTANATNANTKRVESGAAWKRQTKKDNSEFLSIKISFSKERLKSLLENGGDTVDLGFVAFPNVFKGTSDSRPDFRIFEDK